MEVASRNTDAYTLVMVAVPSQGQVWTGSGTGCPCPHLQDSVWIRWQHGTQQGTALPSSVKALCGYWHEESRAGPQGRVPGP